MSSPCDWDKWVWDTATGLSVPVRQAGEKLTSSNLDTIQPTLPDPVADVAPDPIDWQTQIIQWIESTARTMTWFREVITEGLQLEEGDPAVPTAKQIGQVLRALGWTRDRSQKRLPSGVKIVYWRAPERPG